MMRRRGFSLIEIVYVLSILGVLTSLAVPRIRGVIERSEAAALHERVYSVRLAYEAAGSPRPDALRADAGVVPTSLTASLNPDHFRGEGGVLLRIVGSGNAAYLMLSGQEPNARRVRDAFHKLARVPHLHTTTATLVPLSASAMTQIPASHGNTGGNAALPGTQPQATQPTTSQPTTTQPPVTQPAVTQPAVTQPAVTQPAVTQPAVIQPAFTQPAVTQPAVTQPPVTQPPVTQPPVTQPPTTQPPTTRPPTTQPPTTQPPNNAPVCSPSLNPGHYKQCMSGTTHGPPPGHGNPHNGGWFRN